MMRLKFAQFAKWFAIPLLLTTLAGMAAQQTVNVDTPNSHHGDNAYTSFSKINGNFTELYSHTLGSATVAAASTVDLGALAAHFVKITGNTTITSFGASAPAGAIYWLQFTGSPTLTYNATSMIFASAADVDMLPGGGLIMVSLGSGNWSAVAPSLYSLPNDAVPGSGLSLGDLMETLAAAVHPLAGTVNEITVTFGVDGTATLSFPSTITAPSDVTFQKITATDQLKGMGTATNDDASAGQIGEFRDTFVGSGSAVALTSAVVANVTSLTGSTPLATSTLTAGDWDVYGSVQITGSATSISFCAGGINTTSAALPLARYYFNWLGRSGSFAAGDPSFAVPVRRISVAAATTQDVYLIADCSFSGGTASAYGSISARRVR